MDQLLVSLAALIHVYIFSMESLLWGQPKTNKTFRMTAELASHNKDFAFNQGFYNLFLAIAAGVGVLLNFKGSEIVALTLEIYACFSMVGAAMVLLYSKRTMRKAALVQGLPAFLALIFLFIRI